MLDRIRTSLGSLLAGPPEKALCVLPWMQLHARADGIAAACCIAEESVPWPSLHQVALNEAFNSKPMRKLRRDMLRGLRSPACRRCYDVEDGGGESLRNVYNRRWRDRYESLPQEPRDGRAALDQVTYVDLRFSNICNLRCRTCGPTASTAWYQDNPQAAPADSRVLQAAPPEANLWAQLEPMLPYLEVMQFAGGEPMLMIETYEAMEKLLERGLTGVELSYVTNGSSWRLGRRDALELWPKFEKVSITISLDGAGERGEYLRKGIVWPKVLENCRRLRQTCPHAKLRINCTLGLMNALHLPAFLDACEGEPWFELDAVDLNPVQDPIPYSITSLPPGLKQQVRRLYTERMETFGPDTLIARRMAEMLAYMDSRDTSNRLEEWRRQTIELDQKRGESLAATFPELAELMTAG